jgi:tRNA-uridine 2-sulfurtransferase
MSKKGKVLVAMSGGIDSTVAALMYHEQGYEVIGITMKTWDYANSGGSKKETGCCSLDSINDARAVAVHAGFHHFIVDIREEFGNYVIDNFVDEYMAGRTPNPCVLCNTHIKWEALLRRADALDCEYIVTGHYADIQQRGDRYFVRRAIDSSKDQSYVLWGLSQDCLARTKFPLAPFTKPEVRQMSADMGYIDMSKKGESYEICFVPDNDYRGFLRRNVAGIEEKVAGGTFLDASGKVLGKHNGYPFFTIGQRKGLGGRETELIKNGMMVGKLNSMKYANFPTDGSELLTKIRYHDEGALATVQYFNPESLNVSFMANVKGVAPGQSAVFYENDDVVGGGIIMGGMAT